MNFLGFLIVHSCFSTVSKASLWSRGEGWGVGGGGGGGCVCVGGGGGCLNLKWIWGRK